MEIYFTFLKSSKKANFCFALAFLFFSHFSFSQTYDIDRTYGTNCGVTSIPEIDGISLIPGIYDGWRKGIVRGSFKESDGGVITVLEVAHNSIHTGIGFFKTTESGDLDLNFGNNGSEFYYLDDGRMDINSVTKGPDGKIYVVGFYYGGAENGFIGSFNPDGSMNYLFRNGEHNTTYFSVSFTDDGDAVCFGMSHFIPCYLSRVYSPSGTYITGNNFSYPFHADKSNFSHAVKQSTGKHVFCFSAVVPTPGFNKHYVFVRLNNDGTMDNSFGDSGFLTTEFGEPCVYNNQDYGFKLVSNDKMQLGGALSACGGSITHGKLMQFNPDGSPDLSYGTNGSIHLQFVPFQTIISDILFDPATNKTWAVGGTGGNGGLVFRINSNGTLDMTFDNDGMRVFEGYYNGHFCHNFKKAIHYSESRLLLAWGTDTHSEHPGVSHSILDLSTAMLEITDSPACPNVLLEAAVNNPGCFTFKWYKDGIEIAGETTSSYLATSNGDYYLEGHYTGPIGLPEGNTYSNTISLTNTGYPIWYLDADEDGYYTGDPIPACDSPGNGYTTDELSGGNDCDDNDPLVNPEAQEICNTIDDDCDGLTDDEDDDVTGQSIWYQDLDSDGFGNSNSSVESCYQPTGFVNNNEDCDDNDGLVNPDAIEVCNDIDDDCDNLIDDADPGVQGQLIWYVDNDGDGFGNQDISQFSCHQPEGYVGNGKDCDDNNAAIHPDAEEICNNIDDNCNEEVDERLNCSDNDLDGDGIEDDNDNCPEILNPGQEDSDCDSVGDVCDECPGGDDTVDNNFDGRPDCRYPPHYNQIINDWKCGVKKVYVCHFAPQTPGYTNTICINYNALFAHLEHGDFLGPCGSASCVETSMNAAPSVESFDEQTTENHTHLSNRSHEDLEDYQFSNDGITIIPNPTKDFATVNIPTLPEGKGRLTVYSLTGEIIFTSEVASNQAFEMDLTTKVSGMYILELRSGHQQWHSKLMKTDQ